MTRPCCLLRLCKSGSWLNKNLISLDDKTSSPFYILMVDFSGLPGVQLYLYNVTPRLTKSFHTAVCLRQNTAFTANIIIFCVPGPYGLPADGDMLRQQLYAPDYVASSQRPRHGTSENLRHGNGTSRPTNVLTFINMDITTRPFGLFAASVTFVYSSWL